MEDGLKVTGVVGSRETGQAAMEVNSSNRKKMVLRLKLPTPEMEKSGWIQDSLMH